MTLEEAREQAIKAMGSLAMVTFDGIFQRDKALDAALLAYAAAGYVLCNKTLTMDQRNKMSDAFHNNFQSMQAVHDVMLKGVK